jgi:hypothetical protein
LGRSSSHNLLFRELVWTVLMSLGEDADSCPHCRSPFEIVFVKFRFGRTAMIARCPNCAIASADEWRAAESKILDSAKKIKIARVTRGFWRGVASRMDSLNLRFRYVLAFLIGAVITAAALRHSVHTYGGFSREDIRAGALMAIPAVALAIMFFRRKRQR